MYLEKEMTPEQKSKIDNMSYESMLSLWRFAPIGDPLFSGETGEYFSKVIKERRAQVGNGAHVAASKSIGG